MRNYFLLLQGVGTLRWRIQCRAALVRKNIVDSALCEICRQADETSDHIFSECSSVMNFWASIGWALGDIAKVKEI